MFKCKIQNRDILFDAYINRQMSTTDISGKSVDLFGISVSPASVYNSLILYKIPVRNKSISISIATATLDINKSFLDEKTIEWIDGFLLGDGSISHNKITFKSSRFSIGSSEEQWADYGMLGLKKYDPTKASSNGWKFRPEKPSRPIFSSKSKTHPDIALQAKRWYPNGKKIVPSDVRITPISVLLWYLGDGSVGKKGTATNLCLATCGFSFEENNGILIPKLAELGIRCGYEKYDNKILVCSDSIGRFFDLIGRKSPISCYDYKFTIPQWLFLKTLKQIIPDRRCRWKIIKHIQLGRIECQKSPGGHYFLFNKEQEVKLLDYLGKLRKNKEEVLCGKQN